MNRSDTPTSLKQLIRIALVGCLTARVSAALPEIPTDPQKSAAWKEKRLITIQENLLRPSGESIPALGEMARQLGKLNYRECSEKNEVQAELLEALRSMPNHADWFGEEIKKMADDDINQTGFPFKGRREWHFQTLSLMPSPQTVRVLGELLFDERDPGAETPNVPDDSPWAPNCLLSVEALHALGLKNPPVSGKFSDPRKDLRTWQLWFEQVRAGTRSFSFEGDEQIYSLAGPVGEAREPGSAATQPITETSPGSVPPESSKRPFVIAVILAFASLLLAAWRTLKPRRS